MHSLPTHLAAPPRHVPLSLRILNFFNGSAQIGWAIFGFGMIFFWTFGSNADFSFATFEGAGRTTGRVIRVEDTGASENESQVRASHYQYSVAGNVFDGKSYATGAAPAEGAEVAVEYDQGNPKRSRISGMRRAMFGPWAMVVAVFPLVGFVILFFATRSGVKRNHLLREGIVTTGTLLRKEPTAVTVNRQRVWELTFEFQDRAGRRQEVSARTTDTHRLEDEAAEPLLYDPNDSSRAYVLDEVPSRPQFEGNGEIAGRGVAAVFALLLPLLVIGINALAAAVKLGVVRW